MFSWFLVLLGLEMYAYCSPACWAVQFGSEVLHLASRTSDLCYTRTDNRHALVNNLIMLENALLNGATRAEYEGKKSRHICICLNNA
ncbi:hypothetical protein BDW60DRAFT_7405 [Aspergillus nidulans var. acristatus]